jgi:hypothetical protein
VLEGYWLTAPTLPNRKRALGDPDGLATRNRVLHIVRLSCHAPLKFANKLRLAFGEWKKRRWLRTHEQLTELKSQPESSKERTEAACELTARFPPEDRHVLPTELGNVIRAFENHPRTRYGLDGIPIWPSIAAMLTESERADLDEKTTDVAFWLNGLVLVVVGGALLFAERVWHPPAGTLETVGIEVAIVASVAGLAAWMYRQLIGAAARWGEPVRAAFDMHRLELYDRLGVRRPYTREEDVEAGRAVNRLLAFGEPLPQKWRADPKSYGKQGSGGAAGTD